MRALAVLIVVMVGCGDDDGGPPDGSPPPPDAPRADAPMPDAPPNASPDGPMLDASPPCGGEVACQCADGVDNDPLAGDGMDGADPDCLGPYDNDESLFGGFPSGGDPYLVDCSFDGDPGAGADSCVWDLRCVDPPSGTNCQNNQIAGCGACLPLVPNGCDCFGCCDVYVDTNSDGFPEPWRVRLTNSCSPETITDPVACPPCAFAVACLNPCDPCEYCLGKAPDPDCTEGPCPGGVTICDPGGVCPAGRGCVTGCCQPI